MILAIIIFLLITVCNWLMISGWTRNYATGVKHISAFVILVVIFSPVTFIPLVMTGYWKTLAWYPETKKEQEARLMLKKLES